MRQRRGERRLLGFWLLAFAALVACACGAAVPGRGPAQQAEYPQANFAHRVSSGDVDVYWNCTQPEQGVVRMDGVVQNTGGREVQFVTLEAAAANAREYYVSSAKTTLNEILLHINQISPFTLEVSTPAGTRLDLIYAYRFTAAMPEIRNLARDACSPTQHRVRQGAFQ